ncbi:MAG: gamma-glutamylcyclotransferase family protein [Myxococcota bacterium]
MLNLAEMKNLYFAYGSNLSDPDWRRYCVERGVPPSGLVFRSRAWLPDFEVSFHSRSETRKGGALTVDARLGTAVPGALFEADEATWSILDAKEALTRGCYERISVAALDAQGHEWPSITYRVTDAFRTEKPVPPAAGYHELVAAALKELDLPTSQLDQAASGTKPAALPCGLFTYGTLMRNESRWPALALRFHHRLQNPRSTMKRKCSRSKLNNELAN